jgi:hypothetical protein
LPGAPALRYRRTVDAFELDMAFAPGDVAAGLQRLCDRLGLDWACEQRADDTHFRLTFPGGGQVRLSVRPLPSERMTYVGFFPRTLLEARADDGSDLEAFRREILLAFLRVMG